MASCSYTRGPFSDTFQDVWGSTSSPSSSRRNSHTTNLSQLDSPTFLARSTAFLNPSQFEEILRLPTPTFPKSPSAPTFGPFKFSDPFQPTSLEEESASDLPCPVAPQDADFSVNGCFERLRRGLDCPPTPPSLSSVGSPSPETEQLFFEEDKHAYAQDAIRPRLVQNYLRETHPLVKTISPRLLMQDTRSPTPSMSERILKRSRSEGGVPAGVPVAKVDRQPRVIAPIPRRAASLNTMLAEAANPFALPPFRDASQLFERSSTPPSILSSSSASSPSPYSCFSSAAPSPRPDSDTEFEADDEYFPSSDERSKKRRKCTPSTTRSSSTSSSARRASNPPQAVSRQLSGRKTGLQLVLESFPFKYEDIKRVGKFVHCPFEGCDHKTTSEGDLGRHLESSAHATHDYLCLAADCLKTFAREDSMKRHHLNNQGKLHKAQHDRMVWSGYPCRVKKEEVEETKKRVLGLARAQGREL